MVVLEGSEVFFRDTAFNRSISLGQYARDAQDLVPQDEAPLKLLREPGVTVVVSAWLEQFDSYGPRMRVRIFGRGGKIETVYNGLNALIALDVGDFFGTGREVLGVQTHGGHSYVIETAIFLIGASGSRELLRADGLVDHFQKVGGGVPGVWISRETYDGLDARTKGRKLEFWTWDAEKEILVRSAAP